MKARTAPNHLPVAPSPLEGCALLAAASKPPAFFFAVELPLPPKLLSPNVRAHWAAKAKATSSYRAASAFLAKAAYRKACGRGRPREPLNRVVIDMEYRSHRGANGYAAYDAQNAIAATKAAVDGLVDAGVVVRDSARHVSWGIVTIVTTQRELDRMEKSAGVTFTIKAA